MFIAKPATIHFQIVWLLFIINFSIGAQTYYQIFLKYRLIPILNASTSSWTDVKCSQFECMAVCRDDELCSAFEVTNFPGGQNCRINRYGRVIIEKSENGTVFVKSKI